MKDNDQYMLTDDERRETERLVEFGVYSKTYTPTAEELDKLNELYVKLGIPRELDTLMKKLRSNRNGLN